MWVFCHSFDMSSEFSSLSAVFAVMIVVVPAPGEATSAWHTQLINNKQIYINYIES